MDGGTDYNRPRRPNAETLSYLRSLPFDEKKAHEEIYAYVKYQHQLSKKDQDDEGISEVEYPQILTASLAALDEIQHEIASLAGDEFGSQCIETIARISAPYSIVAARKLLLGVSGYMIHLSTHRYGSHVLQTIFQSILEPAHFDIDVKLTEVLELDDNESEISNLPSLKDLILSISEELHLVSKDLAVHICGSHVLRSIICILGGVIESVPSHLSSKTGTLDTGGARRGKAKGNKKKKKNVTVDLTSATNNASHVQYKNIINGRINPSDKDIENSLIIFIRDLTGMDLLGVDNIPKQPGELQHLACNPSACPLLIVLIRILILKDCKESDLRVKESENKFQSDFRLGIHAEENKFRIGSSAERLAKYILCWDDTNQEQAGDIIYGLSGEPRGSHLLELLLRVSNDAFYDNLCRSAKFFDSETFIEYASHDVSNFVIQTLINTARTRTQVETIIKCVDSAIRNGYVLEIPNKRRGILWRTVEMSSKFKIGQETILKSIRTGFSTICKESDISMEDCVVKLLEMKMPEGEGGKLTIDATGARIVYHLLRFVPRLCSDILEGILSNYGSFALEALCNDGLASRCVIDGILDGPTKQKPFSHAVKKLLEKLSGRWVDLSLERVGHHAVKKIFMKLNSMDDKLILARELANKINRLNGNAMGRSVLADCAIKDLLESEDLWRSVVKKRIEKEEFLTELIEGDVPPEKKRKRKRKKGSTTCEDDSKSESKKSKNKEV